MFPVGRLDLDTEGLLLLTNDGDLTQLLTHPRHGVEKEYYVEVEGKPTPAELRTLRTGVELDDGPTHPAQAKILQESGSGTTALTIVVKEGRKRMVRRMCAAVGHPVVRLARTRIGPLRDPHLAPGTWRALPTDEVRALYAAGLGGTRRGRGLVRVTSRPVRLLALRGATTFAEDTKAEINAKTQALVTAMLERNSIAHDDLVSIIFTATDDLTAEFPATAARALGLGDVPLLCARELGIVHGMKNTIRVLMHFYGEQTRGDLHHVYLEGARTLRDDLPE